MDQDPVFIDKSLPPSDEQLEEVLGSSYQIFKSIRDFLSDQVGEIHPEWKFYSPKYGWTLKLLNKKRNLCFISPREGFFNLAFVFGDKAVEGIEKSDLPGEIIDEIVNARKYAEGRGLRMQILREDQLPAIERLFEIKIGV